jgi:hypothetical protein
MSRCKILSCEWWRKTHLFGQLGFVRLYGRDLVTKCSRDCSEGRCSHMMSMKAFAFFLLVGVAFCSSSRLAVVGEDASGEAALAADIAEVVSEQSSSADAATPLVSPVVPAEEISKEEEASKEKLIHAAESFNAASGMWDTDEEKAVDKALAVAMASPSTLGRPDRSLPLFSRTK